MICRPRPLCNNGCTHYMLLLALMLVLARMLLHPIMLQAAPRMPYCPCHTPITPSPPRPSQSPAPLLHCVLRDPAAIEEKLKHLVRLGFPLDTAASIVLRAPTSANLSLANIQAKLAQLEAMLAGSPWSAQELVAGCPQVLSEWHEPRAGACAGVSIALLMALATINACTLGSATSSRLIAELRHKATSTCSAA